MGSILAFLLVLAMLFFVYKLMGMDDNGSDDVKLDRVIDVLRANELHEGDCMKRLQQESQKQTDMYLRELPCDCWLSE